MLKKDELTHETSCLNKAAMDEPLFVVRAKDPLGSHLVAMWADAAEGAHRKEKIESARDLAKQMREWRTAKMASERSTSKGQVPRSVFVVLLNGQPISVCTSGGEASVAAPEGAQIIEYQAFCPGAEPPRPDKLDALLGTLQQQLLDRYNACEDFAATPCSILLATLNAVAEAYKDVRGERDASQGS
ncbi:MAG TPA: hypothetical protein VKA50_12480 [Gammaproteobacteria bacterium]|nr:hypothetical protein [Gammaproteobacteria bacterium]